MLPAWLFVFFCLFLTAIILVRTSLKSGPGTGSYYGNPNFTRETFYDEFLNQVEYTAIKARENNWISVDDIREIRFKLDEIKLIASDNVYQAAKPLLHYAESSLRSKPREGVDDFITLKRKFLEAASQDS